MQSLSYVIHLTFVALLLLSSSAKWQLEDGTIVSISSYDEKTIFMSNNRKINRSNKMSVVDVVDLILGNDGATKLEAE